MAIFKVDELTINATAMNRQNHNNNTTFFSFDRRTAKKILHLQIEGQPLDLTNATVILGFQFVGADASRILDSTDENLVIESAEYGLLSVVLPNDIYAYSGEVLVHVYVEFADGRSLDMGVIVTRFEESWIDTDLAEMEQKSIRSFEELRMEILHRADEINGFIDELREKIEIGDFHGRDGAPGRDGRDGLDGMNGADGRDGRDGVDGVNGQDGKDGLNGQDGRDGQDAFYSAILGGYVGTREEFYQDLGAMNELAQTILDITGVR